MSYFDEKGFDEDDKQDDILSDDDSSSSSSDDESTDEMNIEDDDNQVDENEEIVEDDESIEEDDDIVEDDDDISDNEQDGGNPDSDIEEGEINEEPKEKQNKRMKKIPANTIYKKPDDLEDDDDDDDDKGEQYLQKFDKEINNNYIINHHPESISHNYDEIMSMTKVVRNSDGIIIDKLHRTIPYLTKYEKARILGQRAMQINSGAYPFIDDVPENVIDGYIIAEMELKRKKIPFIIRRPLPNGGSEYWNLEDLEDVSY